MAALDHRGKASILTLGKQKHKSGTQDKWRGAVIDSLSLLYCLQITRCRLPCSVSFRLPETSATQNSHAAAGAHSLVQAGL